MELLIFCVDKLMVMDSSENLHVFNFAILLKSRKYDARKHVFYGMMFTVTVRQETHRQMR